MKLQLLCNLVEIVRIQCWKRLSDVLTGYGSDIKPKLVCWVIKMAAQGVFVCTLYGPSTAIHGL